MTASDRPDGPRGGTISHVNAANPANDDLPQPAPPERLGSLDVFRGATIAAMILVNDAGDWDKTYHPLLHAPWNGWTPTDLIFPFFLFIVGITTHISMTARRERGDDDATLVKQ